MKKGVKLFVIFGMLIFLGGWSKWNDVHLKYGDALDKGISCTYYNQTAVPQTADKFTITSDAKGLYIDFGTGKKTIVGVDTELQKKMDINGKNYSFSDNNIDSFLKNNINDEKVFTCPSQVKIDRTAGRNTLMSSCAAEESVRGEMVKNNDCEVFEKNPKGVHGGSLEGSKEQVLPIEDVNFCETPRVLKTFQIAGYFIFVIKVLVPLLLIIMGTVDFGKAVISKDEKSVKEAVNHLIIRAIAGVIVFLIPTVINYALILVDGATDTASEFSKCTECLLDPKNCEGADLGI